MWYQARPAGREPHRLSMWLLTATYASQSAGATAWSSRKGYCCTRHTYTRVECGGTQMVLDSQMASASLGCQYCRRRATPSMHSCGSYVRLHRLRSTSKRPHLECEQRSSQVPQAARRNARGQRRGQLQPLFLGHCKQLLLHDVVGGRRHAHAQAAAANRVHHLYAASGRGWWGDVTWGSALAH
jgi:hypothetical protein